MIASRPNASPRAVSVDTLFARLQDERTGYGNSVPEVANSNGHAATNGPHTIAEPPLIKGSADLQVAYEWLNAERARLEAYTHSQFSTIQQQHQALLAKQFRSEEALALRAQELNREMKFLASQSEALQARARELAEREAALTRHMESLARAEQEFLSIQQTGNNACEVTEAHRELLEGLRADAARLQAAEADARTDAVAFEAALKERQEAWEKKHATLVARQEAMEQRFALLEKAEAASQRRLAELDELEEQLRKEFDQQEQRLVHDRQEIDMLRNRLRTQIRKLDQGLNDEEEDAVPV